MKLCTVFSLLLLVYTTSGLADSPMLFTGAIQFPRSITTIPDIRIYYCGNKVVCEKQEHSNRISFTIKENRNIKKFLVLVTPAISFETVQETNTIKFLRATPPYKLYTLKFAKKEHRSNDFYDDTPQNYGWEITENRSESRIPDYAIIICYDPNFIETIEGGSAIEFLKVTIKPDILKLVGSEEKFQEKSVEFLLSSIDCDTFHSQIHPEIKQEYQKGYIVI
jgi:hypothetical protein